MFPRSITSMGQGCLPNKVMSDKASKEVRSSPNELLSPEAIHRIVTRKLKTQFLKYSPTEMANLIFFIIEEMHKNMSEGLQVDIVLIKLIEKWEETQTNRRASDKETS